ELRPADQHRHCRRCNSNDRKQRARICAAVPRCAEPPFAKLGDQFPSAPPRKRVQRMIDLEPHPEMKREIFEQIEGETRRPPDAPPDAPNARIKLKAD